MKNILFVLIAMVLILSIVPFATYAEEVETTDQTEVETQTPEEVTDVPTEDTTEAPTESPTEAPTSPEAQEVITLIDRIKEAFKNGDIGTVINLAFDVALLIVCFILKKSSGKTKVEMVQAVKGSKDVTVAAVNDLITATNDLSNALAGDGGIKGIIEDFKANIEGEIKEIKELDKEKLEGYGKELANSMAATKLLAEILQTVYANSTTIPMPVKNMINEKYVEICHKLEGENNG